LTLKLIIIILYYNSIDNDVTVEMIYIVTTLIPDDTAHRLRERHLVFRKSSKNLIIAVLTVIRKR